MIANQPKGINAQAPDHRRLSPGGEAVGPPKPLLGTRPYEPLTFTAEGVQAVADALGIQPARPVVRTEGASPEEQISRRLPAQARKI